MNRRFLIALTVLLIFAAGGTAGYFIGKRQAVRGERLSDVEARVLAELDSAVQFTAAQSNTTRAALAEWSQSTRAINSRQAAEKLTLFDTMTTRIRATLTPEQHAAFDAKTAPLRARLERWSQAGESRPE